MSWLSCLRRYLLALAVGNLIWEALQMPLYAVWRTGSFGQVVLYGLHCLAGDVLIGGSAIVAGMLIAASSNWPEASYRRVAAWTVLIGLAYTAWSEWYNVYVKASWAYSTWMPVVPGLGIGVSPLAQWLMVPGLGLWWARSRGRSQPAAGG